MRNIKYIISIVLILLLTLVTYIYFNKQPVENTPRRATLVFLQQGLTEIEVDISIGKEIFHRAAGRQQHEMGNDA